MQLVEYIKQMDESPSAIYSRFIGDPMKHAPTILGRARQTDLKGLPIPSFLAKAYIPKIQDNPAPYMESLKKVSPDKVIQFIEKNPSLFKGVQNKIVDNSKTAMNKYAQLYTQELQKNSGILEEIGKYRPLKPHDALTKGAPVAAGIGALFGGGSALMAPDEYDERTGKRKIKVMKILSQALAGGAIAGGATAALPSVGRATLGIASDAAIKGYKGLLDAKNVNRPNPDIVKTLLAAKLMSTPLGEGVKLNQMF
jgi:hypothetical protein